jgi:hypothetical protein
MRISDADRDRVASILGDALAEGRLTPEEHSARIDAVFAARTQADLLPAVRDLPGAVGAVASGAGRPGQLERGRLGQLERGRAGRMVALVGVIRRTGAWLVPARVQVVSVLGDVHLDLREATLPGSEIEIRATCVVGGVEIIVPPDFHVIDDGVALVGGREVPPDTPESAKPGAPVLRVSGVSIIGSISVRRSRETER